MGPPSSEADPTPETYHRGRSWVSGRLAGSLAAAAAAWTILRWKPSRVRIEGASMVPTLLPDDWCLVVRPPSWHRGDIAVVEHPGRPGYEMVKRLDAVPGDKVGGRVLGAGEFWVLGDRADASTDSRQFGPVRSELLKARVLLIYAPVERRRMLGRAARST
jgi:nickel-type superoxide dismutase maturation protease